MVLVWFWVVLLGSGVVLWWFWCGSGWFWVVLEWSMGGSGVVWVGFGCFWGCPGQPQNLSRTIPEPSQNILEHPNPGWFWVVLGWFWDVLGGSGWFIVVLGWL